jgi:hypothetical protein
LYLLKNTDRYQSKWNKTNTRGNRNFFENIYFSFSKKKKKKNENELGWAGLSPAAWAGLMFQH